MKFRDWLINRHKEHLIVITFDQFTNLPEITITMKMNKRQAEQHKKFLNEIYKGHVQVFSLHELLPSRVIQDPAKVIIWWDDYGKQFPDSKKQLDEQNKKIGEAMQRLRDKR